MNDKDIEVAVEGEVARDTVVEREDIVKSIRVRGSSSRICVIGNVDDRERRISFGVRGGDGVEGSDACTSEFVRRFINNSSDSTSKSLCPMLTLTSSTSSLTSPGAIPPRLPSFHFIVKSSPREVSVEDEEVVDIVKGDTDRRTEPERRECYDERRANERGEQRLEMFTKSTSVKFRYGSRAASETSARK